MPANGLGHFDIKTMLVYVSGNVCWRLCSDAAETSPSLPPSKSIKEPPTKIEILGSAKYPADPLQRILRVLPKLTFKHLILETLLWQYTMSSNLKSLPEGLKKPKCKKGKLIAQPPILYVPP